MSGVDMENMNKGCVFNIEGYALHDGPGIRTLVFLKGCPISCLWCSNPESQSMHPQLLEFPENCIGCGECIKACPSQAISAGVDSTKTDREKCKDSCCCVEVCYNKARCKYGDYMTVDQVMERLLKDRKFFNQSNGGLTLSGGEPFAQAEFSLALLKESKRQGINNAAETCGHVKTEIFKTFLPFLDVLLFDLKHMDNRKHKELTGVGNQLILKNFELASKSNVELMARIPLIPGLNDDEKNLVETCNFLRTNGLRKLNVLPYHELGVNKYKRMGRPYLLQDIEIHSLDQIEIIKTFIESQGIECAIY
jgi:pyruvate formate lyase activating enzyme